MNSGSACAHTSDYQHYEQQVGFVEWLEQERDGAP